MKLLLKRTPVTRLIFFMAVDAVLITASVYLSFFIRFDGSIPKEYVVFVSRMALLAILFTLPIFYFHKLYYFSWSYVSTDEVISLFKATVISFLFLSVTIYLSHYFPHFKNFPRSTIVITCLLIFIFCGLSRFSKRIYLHMTGERRMVRKEKTLIVGAGDTGEQVLRNILSLKASPYFPVGFVDDNAIKQGVTIHGLKVIGRLSDIPNLVAAQGISQLIIAFPSVNNKAIKRAVELARKSGVKKIKIAPPLSEVMRGEASLKNLRDVAVQDLLGREPIVLDKNKIERFIKDKAVLVTGAAGSIGSELSRQVANFNPSLLALLDQDETGIFNISKELEEGFPTLSVRPIVADVRDQHKIREVFNVFNPKVIFHAAAYKHVPLMESMPDEAVKNNILGTQTVALVSMESQAEKFVFISTDKAVNPTSVMGITKRIGEIICNAYNQKGITKFISVRFGNVLDSRGSVIPLFREQIRKGGPVEVTHPEMERYFMLIDEACLLVMEAGAMGQGGEVFVLDMGKPIKILDLAKMMIRSSGLEPDKDIAIVFIGTRPGEKLFEDILTAEEGTVSTQSRKIYIAKIPKKDFSALDEFVLRLADIAGQGKAEDIVACIKKIVSSYK